ncbi:GNAT family N-acetyltransferase [Halobaculum sp. D14]|uniref:GNAT family N-acetyltransferase n=1 Tax=unclassified Halobaculum TaxID=2640896 RepID=UPI003EBB965F
MTVRVRVADADDALDARRLVDAALLDVPPDLDGRVAAGEVLLAEDGGSGDGDGGEKSALGVLVLDGTHVEAVAVRRRRRGQGVGSALFAAAADRVDGALTAEFRPDVRPFYAALGFRIEERDADRDGDDQNRDSNADGDADLDGDGEPRLFGRLDGRPDEVAAGGEDGV